MHDATQPASTPADGPVPFFFGGRLCLDFINTVNSRSRPATKDYLPDYAAVLGWCRQTRLFKPLALQRLEEEARSAPHKAAEAHAAAIALREALHRIFHSLIAGAPTSQDDMFVLNGCLHDARQRQVLAATGTKFTWIWDMARLDLHSPAGAIAVSAACVLTEDNPARIKECPAPEGCGWLFYDETKNASRRWCSMEHCGSTAKARRYAARHRV